jgi:hypothetical protein
VECRKAPGRQVLDGREETEEVAGEEKEGTEGFGVRWEREERDHNSPF